MPILRITILLLLAGCLPAPSDSDLRRQQLAWERWQQCVHEISALARPVTVSLDASGTRGDAACDGFRRDFLATYPPHYARLIETRLEAPDDASRSLVDLPSHGETPPPAPR